MQNFQSKDFIENLQEDWKFQNYESIIGLDVVNEGHTVKVVGKDESLVPKLSGGELDPGWKQSRDLCKKFSSNIELSLVKMFSLN